MLLETHTLYFPAKDSPAIAIPSSHINRMLARFLDEGKIVHQRMIRHNDGLTAASSRLFRDQAAHEEWWSDPIVKARTLMYEDHYRRNGITWNHTLHEI